MKISALAFSSALMLALGGTALADQHSGGGHIRQACSADFQKFCPNAQSREDRHSCLQTNHDRLSDDCKSALASVHWHGDQDSNQSGSPQ